MWVAAMLYEPTDAYHALIVDLRYQLTKLGHTVIFTSKSLMELKHDPVRVVANLKKTSAEAYVLLAAPKYVLRAAMELSVPVFALFGRMADVPIAGVGQTTIAAMREAIRCLYENGHRRIVKLNIPGARTISAKRASIRSLSITGCWEQLPNYTASHPGMIKVSAVPVSGADSTCSSAFSQVARCFRVRSVLGLLRVC